MISDAKIPDFVHEKNIYNFQLLFRKSKYRAQSSSGVYKKYIIVVECFVGLAFEN